jgi:hypothetical protein
MPASPSLKSVDHSRIARAAVLNGMPIPAQTAAVLSARGVDVGELETRIRASLEFKA